VMSTTFASQTIQSDGFGTFFGEATFLEGGLEDEIYEFSIPRSSGVGEKSAGDRRALHQLRVRWCTTDESTVRNQINDFRKDKTVGSLSVESATSGSLSFQYCRLVDVQWGTRAAGYRPDGVEVSIIEALLTFKQIRVDN